MLVVLRCGLLIGGDGWRWRRLIICRRDRNLKGIRSIRWHFFDGGRVGRGCGSRDGRRSCRMPDEIDFFLALCRPEIDGKDEVRGINVTVRATNFSSVLN